MDISNFRAPLSDQDKFWTAPRFIGLLVVTLAVAFSVLYVASNATPGMH